MKMPRIIVLLLLILAAPYHVQANNSGGHSPQKLRAFVQGFYDWYVPRALAGGSEPAWNIALKAKNGYFTPELALKLQNDARAQAKAEGEIVGLDFDPFLNSQDPGNDYEAGEPTKSGMNYCVTIHSVSSGNFGKKSVLTIEVVQRGGHWQFANFYYPNHLNLLGVLEALRQGREQPPS